MGRDIRELASAGALPSDLQLIAGEEQTGGLLTEQAGEATLISELDEESLAGARIVFLTGPPESSRKALDAAPEAVFIDLSYAAEERPRARLRAPMAEPEGYAPPREPLQVIAHPAAIALAMVLGRLHAAYPVRRAVAHVFEPASERGVRGIQELQQQTVNLLSFKKLPKEVFDEQLSFNMLASYGEEAPLALEEAEGRLERHLATLLALAPRPAPMPSLRLIQVPVFHGYSLSLWAEFENNPGAAELEGVLAGDGIDVREAGMDPPHVVGMAGQSGVAVGAVAVDRNNNQACWFWMAADNFRLAAENAIAVAREFL
jgi:aspartate-semialdehyde dehydrogenase